MANPSAHLHEAASHKVCGKLLQHQTALSHALAKVNKLLQWRCDWQADRCCSVNTGFQIITIETSRDLEAPLPIISFILNPRHVRLSTADCFPLRLVILFEVCIMSVWVCHRCNVGIASCCHQAAEKFLDLHYWMLRQNLRALCPN
jgi:hypothetical protein